jgi:CHAD domain-containing protein
MSASEFLPPDDGSLEAARETLHARLAVDAGGEETADRTFYDTFDGLVRAAGLWAVHERGRLSLIEHDTGAECAGLPMTQPTEPLLVAGLPPGALRETLSAVIEVRALLPLVHVHSRMRALNVLDGERKTVVRMLLEAPAVVGSSSFHTALRPRLRVAAVRGYDDELERVRVELQSVGFRPADQSLVDEAVRANGGVPAGISTKIDLALSPSQRADAAVTAVLRRLLAIIEANLEGTIADIDAEFLHDFRVSVRRTRGVLREFRGLFPPAELARFRREFRWLQQVTGETRDLDVYVLGFDPMRDLLPDVPRAELDPVAAVLNARRLSARRAMVRALRGQRTHGLLQEWPAVLEELVELPLEDRPDAVRPVVEVAAKRIRKVYARMVDTGAAIGPDSPSEEYHELRKRGKELRYLLELFGAPLFAEEVVRPMVKKLKALQDVLGRHQDREVQTTMLQSLRDDVAAAPGGPAALMAMGVLVQRLRDDERAARADFAERFAGFSDAGQQRRVRDTFS